jgi:hypothetical protein
MNLNTMRFPLLSACFQGLSWYPQPVWLVVFGCLVAGPLAAAETAPTSLPVKAKWIWHPQADYHPYNQTIIARKTFRVKQPEQATLAITADSFYRVFINGQWVNDGPCRSWPEHFQYDVIDARPYLVSGKNEIRVVARYYGVGDFHRVPQQAGLLAQLNIRESDGQSVTIATDGSWDTAIARAWDVRTPKASIQMEPCEWYDARLEDKLEFRRAAVLFEVNGGPWKDLNPRDVALLSRQPVAFKSFAGAKVVRAEGLNFCLPAARLVNPGLIEANHATSLACGMATILENSSELTLSVQTEGMKLAVDGKRNAQNQFKLSPGRHLVMAMVSGIFGHEKEKALRFKETSGYKLENPLQAGYENPWCFIRFPEYAVATNDLVWIDFKKDDPSLRAAMEGYSKASEELLNTAQDLAQFKAAAGRRAELLPSNTMFVRDIYWQFTQRQVIEDAAALVRHGGALIHDNPEVTTVQPSAAGDIELLYDLGEQNCGYYRLDLVADAGVIVDVFSLEYITPDGRLQHSWGNRNGMRYITRQGRNDFLSLKRRSGRFVFLTLRGAKTPVQIRHFGLVESTYPVEYTGNFSCSDARLDRIWEISTRTLKLCMEDTYVDCPLYEQTHWVGDARNESLLAFGVFGAYDLARRCIQITAQSLEHYPIAGCQTPSGWDCLLPAWSFLWGISTWDYYWETGDKAFLRSVYPAVIRNLRGAERFVNDRDLFSGPFWNMFDWTGADQGQKTVLHNSMFMVGAIDAALRSARELGETRETEWLTALRSRLLRGVNRLWDPSRQAYPDSVRDDGSISPSTCQHTSFLALLYDLIEKENVPAAVKNLTAPPEKMVRIGSPFAMLYLYETYEKLGMEDQILIEIYTNYLPMLESGATTVWESFPSGTLGGDGFPTRSHCHAWSSAPTRFLNRILLGVKATSPGGTRVEISPRLNNLAWARGITATARGPVSVSWKVSGGVLDVKYSVPAEVKASFVRNATHAGLQVRVNGQAVP